MELQPTTSPPTEAEIKAAGYVASEENATNPLLHLPFPTGRKVNFT